MAILTLGFAAPLHGRPVTDAVDAEVLSSWAGGEVCGAEQATLFPAVMNGSSYAGLPCSAGGVVLVEAAESHRLGWATGRIEDRSAVPEFGGASFQQVSNAQPASFVTNVTVEPPDDAPRGTRVPEPATLVLLGAGMLALSRVARLKRQRRNPLRLAATQFGPTPQH